MKNQAIYAIITSFLFSVMNALVKVVSDSIPTTEIVFFRSSIGALLIWLIIYQQKIKFSTQDIPLLLTRGIMGSLSLIANFYVLSHLPLADAGMLYYLSPLFTILLAIIILRNKVNLLMLMWIVIVIAAAITLIRPWDFSSYMLNSLIGVLGALLAAIVYLSVSVLSKRHHNYEIVFYFLFTASIITFPFMAGKFVYPSPFEWFILISIAIVSLVMQIFLNKSLATDNIIIVSAVSYIGIVFNIAFGYLFWDEIPFLLSVIASFVLLFGCAYLTKQQQILNKQK